MVPDVPSHRNTPLVGALVATTCRSGIHHLLTAPSPPNQNGKVERFRGTLRPASSKTAGLFDGVAADQAVVDVSVEHYDADQPHQALDQRRPVTPAQRFTSNPPAERELVGLWLPPALEPLTGSPTPASPAPTLDPVEAVELEKVGPAAGTRAAQ